MSAIGDIGAALGPAAQGISAGQLAGAQQQMEQQHYQDTLGLQQQAAQNQAKQLKLEQDRFDLEDRKGKLQGAGQLLQQLHDTAFNDANFHNPMERRHQAAMQNAYLHAASFYAKGDLDGTLSALQAQDTFLGPHAAEANGGAAAAPSATPPTQGGAQPQSASGMPPEAMQAIQGLLAQAGKGQTSPAVGQPIQDLLAQAGKGQTSPPGPLATTQSTIVPGQPLPEGTQPVAPPTAAAPGTPTAAPTAPTAVPVAQPGQKFYANDQVAQFKQQGYVPVQIHAMWKLDQNEAAQQTILHTPQGDTEDNSVFNERIKDAHAELKQIDATREKLDADAAKRIDTQAKQKYEDAKADADRLSRERIALISVGKSTTALDERIREANQRADDAKLDRQIKVNNLNSIVDYRTELIKQRNFTNYNRAQSTAAIQNRTTVMELSRALENDKQTMLAESGHLIQQGRWDANGNLHVGGSVFKMLDVGGGIGGSRGGSTTSVSGAQILDTPLSRKYIETRQKFDEFFNRAVKPPAQSPEDVDKASTPPTDAEKKGVAAMVKAGTFQQNFLDAYRGGDVFGALRKARIYSQVTNGNPLPAGVAQTVADILHPLISNAYLSLPEFQGQQGAPLPNFQQAPGAAGQNRPPQAPAGAGFPAAPAPGGANGPAFGGIQGPSPAPPGMVNVRNMWGWNVQMKDPGPGFKWIFDSAGHASKVKK